MYHRQTEFSSTLSTVSFVSEHGLLKDTVEEVGESLGVLEGLYQQSPLRKSHPLILLETTRRKSTTHKLIGIFTVW